MAKNKFTEVYPMTGGQFGRELSETTVFSGNNDAVDLRFLHNIITYKEDHATPPSTTPLFRTPGRTSAISPLLSLRNSPSHLPPERPVHLGHARPNSNRFSGGDPSTVGEIAEREVIQHHQDHFPGVISAGPRAATL